MKFTCKTTIDLPRAKVIELFNNPDNLVHWQDGFISFKHLEGQAGQVGTKSLMTYMIKGKPMEITETITVSNLPDELSGLYESTHMDNTMSNYFKVISEDRTEYISKVEYIRFNGFMVKMMAFLFPGIFKKQVQKWMNQFKEFAENADK